MQDDKRTRKIIYIIGIIPIIWFALLIAPYLSGGLIEIIKKLLYLVLLLIQLIIYITTFFFSLYLGSGEIPYIQRKLMFLSEEMVSKSERLVCKREVVDVKSENLV